MPAIPSYGLGTARQLAGAIGQSTAQIRPMALDIHQSALQMKRAKLDRLFDTIIRKKQEADLEKARKAQGGFKPQRIFDPLQLWYKDAPPPQGVGGVGGGGAGSSLLGAFAGKIGGGIGGLVASLFSNIGGGGGGENVYADNAPSTTPTTTGISPYSMSTRDLLAMGTFPGGE